MNGEKPVTHVEFVGGPEDGRSLPPELFQRILETGDKQLYSEIPLLMSLDTFEQPGEDAEISFVGRYVAQDIENGVLRYLWSGS